MNNSQPRFEPIEMRADCDYCNGRLEGAPRSSPIDAVFCISLQDAPERTRKAADHFHQVGLCRDVVFYRPVRGDDTPRAVWTSHRAVACQAVAQRFQRVLILEDDATFSRPWPALAPRVAAAIAELPADWWGLYLGHWPLQGYFVRPTIMRVRSVCAHAYLAGPQLLQWLAATEPMRPDVPVWPGISSSVDGAFANLPGMYAMFPMIAAQRFMGEHRPDRHFTPDGKRRGFLEKERYGAFAIYHLMRPAELATALLSPIHRAIMARRNRANGPPRGAGGNA
jgi:hypothetical protein